MPAAVSVTARPDAYIRPLTRPFIRLRIDQVCLDPLDDAVVTECGHIFCRECILAAIGRARLTQCPYCRAIVYKDRLKTLPRASRFAVDIEDEKQWRSSAKVSALLSELRRDTRGDRGAPIACGSGYGGGGGGGASCGGGGGGVKSVVFSQWTAMLDLVVVALKREEATPRSRRDRAEIAPRSRRASARVQTPD